MVLWGTMVTGTRKVGVVLHRLKDQPWDTRLREELEANLSAHPEVSLLFADPEGNPVLQGSMVETLLRGGVEALVIAPLNPEVIQATLRLHNHAAVPVVLLDGELDDPELSRTVIMADNRQFGRKMGEFFLEATDGVADLVEIRGVPTMSATLQRSEGFRQALAGSKVRIVESVVGNWLHADAREEFTKVLARLPRIDGVFAQNDEMARGAWDAAEAVGRAGEMLFTGVDALKGGQGLQLVMQGKLAASLLKPVPGQATASALLAILGGEPCLPRYVLQTSLFRSHEALRAWREARKARPGADAG
jgi:ABC-type sugar transport system substrate-binding protein